MIIGKIPSVDDDATIIDGSMFNLLLLGLLLMLFVDSRILNVMFR